MGKRKEITGQNYTPLLEALDSLQNLRAIIRKPKFDESFGFKLASPGLLDYLSQFEQSTRMNKASALQNGASKQEDDGDEGFEPSLHCSLEANPEQPRRMVHCNNTISLQKKLNTVEFDHYKEKIWRLCSEERKASFTCLDPFWFAMYVNKSSKTKVLSWIGKEGIFSKQYIFVPIVLWSHWCLLILCNFGESLPSKPRNPCMLLLDSLERAGPRRFEPNIRKFVLDICEAEGRPESKRVISKIPLLVPKVPQQRNGEQCGHYVLYYMNLFLEGAPANFSVSDGYPYFMKRDWFNLQDLEQFFDKLTSVG